MHHILLCSDASKEQLRRRRHYANYYTSEVFGVMTKYHIMGGTTALLYLLYDELVVATQSVYYT